MLVKDLYAVFQEYPSVQTDSRKIKKGDLFFALKGPNFNGNKFAAKAIDDGAAYAIIDEKEFDIPGKTILVEDVLMALQQLSNLPPQTIYQSLYCNYRQQWEDHYKRIDPCCPFNYLQDLHHTRESE